jgi:hypothetical protein
MSLNAALMWQKQAYRKILKKFKLPSDEWEEIQLLKLKTEDLRNLSKRFLKEKFD